MMLKCVDDVGSFGALMVGQQYEVMEYLDGLYSLVGVVGRFGRWRFEEKPQTLEESDTYDETEFARDAFMEFFKPDEPSLPGEGGNDG